MQAMPKTFGSVGAQALVTRPAKGIWLLSMSHLPDNRLSPDFIKHALIPALDDIELTFRRDFEKGDKEAALVFTGERVKNKFFSNGLDLELVAECPGFFKDYYYALMERILTFPMHTVAALNGHTFAGGFCLSQVADHRIMRADRAWTCMNELDFGAPLPAGMHAVLANRLPSTTLRRVMLTAHRFTAPEALEAGIIDEIVQGDGEAVIARGIEIAQAHAKYSQSGVLSMLKQTLFADVIKGLHLDESIGNPTDQNTSKLAKLVAAAAQAKL